jgi:hypothetical protein
MAKTKNSDISAATFGYEAQLWQTADTARGSMDAVEYKRVALGLMQRRQGEGRHLDLRPGVELHDLAVREDEPRHPRHRRPDRARRHLPQRPPPDLNADFILANGSMSSNQSGEGETPILLR